MSAINLGTYFLWHDAGEDEGLNAGGVVNERNEQEECG